MKALNLTWDEWLICNIFWCCEAWLQKQYEGNVQFFASNKQFGLLAEVFSLLTISAIISSNMINTFSRFPRLYSPIQLQTSYISLGYSIKVLWSLVLLIFCLVCILSIKINFTNNIITFSCICLPDPVPATISILHGWSGIYAILWIKLLCFLLWHHWS